MLQCFISVYWRVLCVCVCGQQSYDILLLILMVMLLVQAGLTLATVIHCASYKGQLRLGAPEWDDSSHLEPHLCEVVPLIYPCTPPPPCAHTDTHTRMNVHMFL